MELSRGWVTLSGILNGSYAIHKGRGQLPVASTRVGFPVDRCWINGAEIPLIAVNPDYPVVFETPEFIAVNPEDDGPFPPGIQVPVPVAVDQEFVRISLEGPGDAVALGGWEWLDPRSWFKKEVIIKHVPGSRAVPEYMNEHSTILHEVTVEMYREGWKPDDWDPADPHLYDGEFGEEVHRRMAARLNQREGWAAEVWLTRSADPAQRRILSIGAEPPGGTSGRGNIDAVRLKTGQTLSVGDVWDSNKVEHLFELKTSIDRGIDEGQKQWYRLLAGSAGFDWCTTAVKWTPHDGGGWKVTRKFFAKYQCLAAIGAAKKIALEHAGDVALLAVAAWAFYNNDQFDDDLFVLEASVNRVANLYRSGASWLDCYSELVVAAEDMRHYLSNFVDDPQSVNIGIGLALYTWMGHMPDPQ